MVATRPSCLVCEAVEGKYKCPRCNVYTCSLACSREHRDNHPAVEVAGPSPSESSSSYTTCVPSPVESASGQTGPSSLVDMPEYKMLMQRYPTLEMLLWQIAEATDPPQSNGNGANDKCAGLPGFHQGKRKPNKPWTKDEGMENGLKMLQYAKQAPNEPSEAIREFCELYWMYKARSSTEEGIRQQRAEDAQAIGRLLKDEKTL
ncbi:hypothetical protein GGR56DRAFT_371504 [Xylariaceae sp. FL0804]|nr:hypothetical protein GGR56DRAFT_371504 [Xylariaceae sp. FL0804]